MRGRELRLSRAARLGPARKYRLFCYRSPRTVDGPGAPERQGPARRRALGTTVCDQVGARWAPARLQLGDDGLDGRLDARGDLDGDHVRADGLDRLVEVDVPAVDPQAARLVDRVGDVLGGDRAE